MKILGERIDLRLKALDKNQPWLARETGLKQPTINAYLKGKVKRPGKLKELAEALQTSQQYLLGETDDPCVHQEKIPPAVIEAFEKIPGTLTEREVDLIVGQLDLIALSRTSRNDGSQNNGQQPEG